jgi:hypothetical protein
VTFEEAKAFVDKRPNVAGILRSCAVQLAEGAREFELIIEAHALTEDGRVYKNERRLTDSEIRLGVIPEHVLTSRVVDLYSGLVQSILRR